MNDALKTMMRAAILDKASDGWSGDACAVDVDDALQAALQAIHDAGQAIVPNGVVDALKTAEAWLTTWGSHVGNCAARTRCTCGLEAVSAEIGHAIFQASQPKTEGGET